MLGLGIIGWIIVGGLAGWIASVMYRDIGDVSASGHW